MTIDCRIRRSVNLKSYQKGSVNRFPFIRFEKFQNSFGETIIEKREKTHSAWIEYILNDSRPFPIVIVYVCVNSNIIICACAFHHDILHTCKFVWVNQVKIWRYMHILTLHKHKQCAPWLVFRNTFRATIHNRIFRNKIFPQIVYRQIYICVVLPSFTYFILILI